MKPWSTSGFKRKIENVLMKSRSALKQNSLGRKRKISSGIVIRNLKNVSNNGLRKRGRR